MNKINLPIEQHFVHCEEPKNGIVGIWVDNIDLSSKVLLKNPKDEFTVGFD